jgi:hypothetical protein
MFNTIFQIYNHSVAIFKFLNKHLYILSILSIKYSVSIFKFLNKHFFTNPLVVVFFKVSVFGICIYTLYDTILALGTPTIYCDSELETLIRALINSAGIDPTNLMVILSNLEYLQDLVGVPANGYDIDWNNPQAFFQLLFISQDLCVELVDGVFLNVLKVADITYTVHPSLIQYLLDLLADIFF